MIGNDQHPAAAAWLSRLSAVLTEFHDLPVGTFTDDQVLALWRDAEAGRRQLAPVDHVLVQEVQSRHLPSARGAKSMTELARDVLRVSAFEARLRVADAEALGPRRSFTGEPLAPIYPQVAAAQRSGSLGDGAARVIVKMIEKLPDQVRCEKDVECEQLLVEQAQILDVDALKQVAHRLALTLDPDGLFKDVEYRRKHRDFRLSVRTDGSSHGEFEATAELTEWLRTVLDTTARPAPEADGVKDPRTPGQRHHDGLLEALKLLARAELLPDVAGITTNVLLTTASSRRWAGSCA
jgi:hypothetical protein